MLKRGCLFFQESLIFNLLAALPPAQCQLLHCAEGLCALPARKCQAEVGTASRADLSTVTEWSVCAHAGVFTHMTHVCRLFWLAWCNDSLVTGTWASVPSPNVQSLNTGSLPDCSEDCSIMFSCVSCKAEQKSLRKEKEAETVLVV